MDYEKKYNEALDRAREIKSKILSSHLSTESCKAVSEYIDTIIPELAEDEDERIREFLYEFIKICAWSEKQYPSREKCLAYLEKQKEQKPAEWKPNTEQMEALLLAIEGEWDAIKPTGYMSRRLEDLYDGFVNTFNVDEKYLDNLPKTAYTEKDIEEIKALKEKIQPSMDQKPDKCNGCNNYKGCITCVDSDQWAHIEEVPANVSSEKPNGQWEWEDDVNLNAIIEALRWCNNEGMNPDDIDPNYLISWIKSIRPQPKQGWSDEDKRILKGIIGLIDHNQHYGVGNKEMLDWLKSLRPRPHWKPSKQEMDAFETALKGEFQNGVYPASELCKLFGELKKLYYNDEIPPSWKPREEQMDALKEASANWMNQEMGNCELLESLYNDLLKL